MNILYGLIAGVLGYFVAQLVLGATISALIGIVIFLVVAFGADHWAGRRI